MKKILFFLLISVSVNAQISTKCAVCPPTLRGVANGSVLRDSSGYARWQSVAGFDTAAIGVDSLGSLFWGLNGNTGTNPATDFVGTTDSVGFRIENSSNEVGIGLQSIKISGHGLNDALGIVIAGESENEEGIFIDGYSASQTSVKIYGYTDGASPDWSDIEINAQTGKLKITGINEGAGKVLISDANGLTSFAQLAASDYTGIPAYANNAAAFAVLGAGKLYYTDVAGEYILKVTH